MALGDSSFSPNQLANQTQAMLAANQLTNYSGFLRNSFSGLTSNLPEGVAGMDTSEASHANGKLANLSPISSNHNVEEEQQR